MATKKQTNWLITCGVCFGTSRVIEYMTVGYTDEGIYKDVELVSDIKDVCREFAVLYIVPDGVKIHRTWIHFMIKLN